MVHSMGISELALALQCLHALGVTWRSITTDNAGMSIGGGGTLNGLGLGVVALREHMIRVYHTALLDYTDQDKDTNNDQGQQEGSLFVMGESRTARTLRQAMVAIGTTYIHPPK